MLLAGLFIATVYALLFLGQMWFEFMSAEVFLKVTLSFWVIGVLIFISIGILYAIREDEELKKGNYLG